MTPDRDIAELVAAAEALPYGDARLALFQEAVGRADNLADRDLGYTLRQQLIDTARVCLRYDLYAASFAWCLATAQDRPDKYSVADLLGDYQDVVCKVVNFPDVTRARYEDLFADVLRQFRAHGQPLRSLYVGRRSVAFDFGDRVMAADADRELGKHPRDAWSGTRDYEATRQLEHEHFLGDDAAAVRTVDGYFARADRERFFGDTITAYALAPLHRVGRAADADRLQRAAAPHFRPGRGYAWCWAEHLSYLARVGAFDRAVRFLAAQWPVALAQTDPLSRFHFLRHAAVLLDRLAAAGRRTIPLRPAGGLPWGGSGGQPEVGAVRDWVRSEAAGLAAQFDARNGNTCFSAFLSLETF